MNLAPDAEFDPALRPQSFDDYLGQKDVKERLRVAVRAAKMRGEPMDHVLLSGPPGLGKTTMANIIAEELGVGLVTTSGPGIDKKGDLAGVLTALEDGDVLFIDEIHRLSSAIEENLYPAMEDFRIDIMLGEGPNARSMQLPLNRFTLVAATTRMGLLSSPLLGRFGIQERLEFYTADELATIVARSARLLNMVVDDDAALEIARRSRGTPRNANMLLRRVRDYMEVEGLELVDQPSADEWLTRLDIDKKGFGVIDRKYLNLLVHKYEGGPVGVKTLAAVIGEPPDTIEDVYEPYLIQEGFIDRTPRGRVATRSAITYMGGSVRAGTLSLFDNE